MNYTIIGAGKSGLSAALLAQKDGETVFLTESKAVEHYAETAKILSDAGIAAEFGGHSARALRQTDCVVVSPGVPPSAPILREAESRGIPIISELEFGSRHISNPIIAITGTNGKTTTTALTTYILNRAGKPAIACGNIGTPLSALVPNITPETILVVEASSYQLDRCVDFRPDVAAILNISPDHLSYHGSLEAYIRAKYKITLNQNEKNVLILNHDDALSSNSAAYSQAKRIFFSANPLQQGAYVRGGVLVFRDTSERKEEEIMLLQDIRIPGVHNVYNSLAASTAARVFEVHNEDIRDSLMSFNGVEHRLEFVREFCGVEFINDSKATNVNSTWYALGSYSKPIVWIAGGRGDNNDYSTLEDGVRNNVKCIIAIGEEANAIFNHFSAMTRCIKADSMQEAVSRSMEFASGGDVVLFSPACKSFDMFMNYEHRGEVFKQAVEML